MIQVPLHIIPFEDLLDELREGGMTIGVDTYERVQHLLNAGAEAPAPSFAQFRANFAALIAHSEAEQAQVYQAFDDYVARFSYEPPSPDDEEEAATRLHEQVVARRRLRRQFFRIGSGILLVIAGLILFQPRLTLRQVEFLPGNQIVIQAQQRTLLERIGKFRLPAAWVKRQVSWELGDGNVLTDTAATLLYTYPDLQPRTVQVSARQWFFQNRDSIKVLASRSHYRAGGSFPAGLGTARVQIVASSLTAKAATSPAETYQLATQWVGGKPFDQYVFDPAQASAPQLRYLTHWDSLHQAFKAAHTLKLTHTWNLGDGHTAQGDTVLHRFAPGNWTVSYTRRAQYYHRQTGVLVFEDSVQARRVITVEAADEATDELLPVPLPQVKLIPEDLSDLLKPRQVYLYVPGYLSLLIMLLYGLYELYRWRRQRVVLDASQANLGPPLSQHLRIDRPTLKLFGGDHYEKALLDLRRRAPGGGRELNVPLTIEATLRQGDIPDFRYTALTVSSQYLVLIDRTSIEDHFSHYVEDLVGEMNQRDISAEYYFFQGSPHWCRRRFTESETEVSLERLTSLFAGYRLIVVSDGAGLLDPYQAQLDPTMELLRSWTLRTLLSPKPTEEWGFAEQQLQQGFPVLLPATPAGLARLLPEWQVEQPANWRELRSDLLEPAIPAEEVDELRTYLGPKGFRWLCACAVYPELHYELTLQLGQRLGAFTHAAEEDYRTLRRLFGLPWLREGALPEALRLALYRQLKEEDAQQARALLIAILSQEQNQAPTGSYARQDQQTSLALYRYLNSAQDAQAQEELEATLSTRDPQALRDVVTLQDLDTATDNPLALILPRGMFRGAIPYFGLKTVHRALLGLLLPLVLVWGGYGVYRALHEGRGGPRPFTAENLSLANAEDSARYYSHRLWGLAADSSRWIVSDTILATYEQAQPWMAFIFEQHAYSGAITSPTHNASALSYRVMSRLYELGEYEQVTLLPDDYMRAIIDLKYVLGLSQLMQQAAPLAVPLLMTYHLPWASDTASRASRGMFTFAGKQIVPLSEEGSQSYYTDTALQSLYTRALPQSRTRLIALLRAYADPSADSVQTLLSWLGVAKKILHATLVDAATGEPLSQAQVLLGGGNRLSTAASGRLFYRYDTPPLAQVDGTVRLPVRIPGYKTFTYDFALFQDSSQQQTLRLRLVPDEANLRVSLADTAGCMPFTLKAKAQADKPIQGYRWELRDIETLQVVRSTSEVNKDSLVFTIQQAGRFMLQLVVAYADGTPDTLFDLPLIAVRPLPDARFTLSSSPDNPLSITAIPSKLTYDRYDWDYGDRTGSVFVAGTHTYADSGTYAVRLIVANACGADTVVRSIKVAAPTDSLDLPFPAMVSIPGGSFQMGDVLGDGAEDEKPVHTVSLSAFELGETEVTFAQYDAFCEATGRVKPEDRGWGRGERPVINVSWQDAVAYCNWLSAQRGYEAVYTISGDEVTANWQANGYRLPTEAEWEYAARQAGDTVRFGNGQDTARATEINFNASATYKSPYSQVGTYRAQTVPVRSFAPSRLGLYEMSGNVYEWCWDWYQSDYDASSPSENPKGPGSGSGRVLRGGSWGSAAGNCRVALRYFGGPSNRGIGIGFRLARSL